jgi:hypothetical protein
MSELHFKLPSGRVLLLKEPLTDAEREECSTPEGLQFLESLADAIGDRCGSILTPEDPMYAKLLEQHGLA